MSFFISEDRDALMNKFEELIREILKQQIS